MTTEIYIISRFQRIIDANTEGNEDYFRAAIVVYKQILVALGEFDIPQYIYDSENCQHIAI